MTEAGRSVERELELLVERRSDALRPDEEERDPLWRRSCEAHADELRRANRSAWCAHHINLATLHDRLAEEPRIEARKLTERSEG